MQEKSDYNGNKETHVEEWACSEWVCEGAWGGRHWVEDRPPFVLQKTGEDSGTFLPPHMLFPCPLWSPGGESNIPDTTKTHNIIIITGKKILNPNMADTKQTEMTIKSHL